MELGSLKFDCIGAARTLISEAAGERRKIRLPPAHL